MRVQLKRFGIRTAAQLGVAAIVSLSVEHQAQAQRLPPPPNVPAIPIAPLPSTNPDIPPQAPINVAPNERIYTAPRVNPSMNSVQPVSGRFRVFVDSGSPYVLQRVRLVQPDAFIQNTGGRRVIQAGTFNNEVNARQQVSRLASQGIDAQITGGFLPGNLQRGYYAIVPGNQFEVQDYRDRAIRLGMSRSVVRIRNRPLGLHLAVGAFSDQREAERTVQDLRDRGRMDARLFYNP